MPAAIKPSEFISVKDYLAEELERQIKHELIDGHIYAMADVSANHVRIAVNVLQKFSNHLENAPCEHVRFEHEIARQRQLFLSRCNGRLPV